MADSSSEEALELTQLPLWDRHVATAAHEGGPESPARPVQNGHTCERMEYSVAQPLTTLW